MATARTIIPEPTPPPTVYSLDLTEAEAQALRVVLANIVIKSDDDEIQAALGQVEAALRSVGVDYHSATYFGGACAYLEVIR